MGLANRLRPTCKAASMLCGLINYGLCLADLSIYVFFIRSPPRLRTSILTQKHGPVIFLIRKLLDRPTHAASRHGSSPVTQETQRVNFNKASIAHEERLI